MKSAIWVRTIPSTRSAKAVGCPVLTRPGDDDTPEFPVQDYESALNRYCAALYWAVRATRASLGARENPSRTTVTKVA